MNQEHLLYDLGLEVRILLIRYEHGPTQKVPASELSAGLHFIKIYCSRIYIIHMKRTNLGLDETILDKAKVIDWPTTRLEYTRHVKGKEKHDAYRKSDIVVMPSRYEPFGLVGLEALAAGCLLLAPEGLGMDEYYIPGINGVSIKNSPGDIATTLIKVIENWKEFLPLKTRAVETAKSWTWNRSAEFHARLYRNLLEPRNKAWNSCFSRSALLDREARPEIQEPVSQLLAWCQGLKFERILFIEPSEDLRVSLNGCWLIHSHHQDSYSDWSWLPFEEGSFDLVVAFGVLEYSSRVFSVLEEWRRISKALLLGILPEGLAPQRKGSFDMPEDGKFLAPEWSCESIELNWEMGKTWLLEKP